MINFVVSDTNNGSWDGNEINQVVPAAASLAGLSSLGLLRDRMMKRQPKEEEALNDLQSRQREERRRKRTQKALSTAAGLSTFAAIGSSADVSALPSGRDFAMNPGVSSFLTTARSSQNLSSESIRNSVFEFNDGIANAATTEVYDTVDGFSSSSNNAVLWENEHSTNENEQTMNFGESAVPSSSSLLSSEFSRGTNGIYDYDTKMYPKERLYSNVESGFDPPLKESSSRKGRFMFGGVSLRSLKSKFDSTFVKEVISEPEQNAPKAVSLISPQAPLPGASIIPENIPLSNDDFPPVKHALSQTTSNTKHLPLQDRPEPTVVLEEDEIEREEPRKLPHQPAEVSAVKTSGIEYPTTQYYQDSTTFPTVIRKDSRTFPVSRIESPDAFYKGLAGGTLAAAVSKGFHNRNRKRVIGATPQKFVSTQSGQNRIDADQPYAFRSSNANMAERQQSDFEVQTITSSASSYTQTKPGGARVSVAVESTLRNGSSVKFSASSNPFEGASFSERSRYTKSYREDSIDTLVKGSYLDSLSNDSSISGVGMQSYLEGLSSLSMRSSYDNYSIRNSMEQCESSLDSISQSLDYMPMPDMDFDTFDTVYKDLQSATNDIALVSETLEANDNIAVESMMGTQPRYTTTMYGLSSDGAVGTNKKGCDESSISSQEPYLETISQNSASVTCGQGLTSYLSDLTSMGPLSFDIPQQGSFNAPVMETEHNSMTSEPEPISIIQSKRASEKSGRSGGRPRRVRVFVESSVDISRM